jgi:putative pyruvate formate lyase activating enzyme
LRLLEGVIDVYMPDFKCWNPDASETYLLARDYPERAQEAVREMHRQVGDLKLDEHGLAVRGVLVRHLVMPGGEAESRQILSFLAREISKDTFVNVMGQYHPAWKAVRDPRLSAINRRPTPSEIRRVQSIAREVGLSRLDAA